MPTNKSIIHRFANPQGKKEESAPKVKTTRCPLEEILVCSPCPISNCAYHSKKLTSGCLAEGGIPEADEISDTQIRIHKGLTAEEFSVEKAKAFRQTKRTLIIMQVCDWMDSKPSSWFFMTGAYEEKRLKNSLKKMSKRWPWNVKECNWRAGKICMILRETTWVDFAKEKGFKLKEPSLRILGIDTQIRQSVIKKFVAATSRINSHSTNTQRK